jgi:hypothetical protein
MRTRTVSVLWVLLASFRPALADSVITPPAVDDPSVSMLELEAELFGLNPADFYSVSGSDPFWNADNASLYGNLGALILSLGGDSSMISQLFVGGGAFSGGGSLGQPAASANVLSGGDNQSPTPEPATMGLLGGALLFFGCYAIYRSRKLRPELASPPREHDGPTRRFDQTQID